MRRTLIASQPCAHGQIAFTARVSWGHTPAHAPKGAEDVGELSQYLWKHVGQSRTTSRRLSLRRRSDRTMPRARAKLVLWRHPSDLVTITPLKRWEVEGKVLTPLTSRPDCGNLVLFSQCHPAPLAS